MTGSDDAITQQPEARAAVPAVTLTKALDYTTRFLPKHYPSSVPPAYLPYIKWQFAASACSTATGVLSMQALLFAIGLGAVQAIPAAAAINWVLKDGLGQLGGMLFANVVSNRFDADPKRFRMIAAYACDLSTLVEMLTPLVPHLFLPMASVANVGKNVSWLAASSTRASIHRTFAHQENLADITAKAGSQSIAASLVGTGLGIGLSSYASGDTGALLACFSVLSAGHLASTHHSLSFITFTTLNRFRLQLLMEDFLHARPLRSPDAVSQEESFAQPWQPKTELDASSSLRVGVPLPDLAASSTRLGQLAEACDLPASKYLLGVRAGPRGVAEVSILFEAQASAHHVLVGFLHAHKVRQELQGGRLPEGAIDPGHELELLRSTRQYAQDHGVRFVAELEGQDWNVKHQFVETETVRFTLA